MLCNELKEMTMKAVDQKEYDEIVEEMKDVAKSGKCYVCISHISEGVLEKLKSEGILIRKMMLINKPLSYVLSWI